MKRLLFTPGLWNIFFSSFQMPKILLRGFQSNFSSFSPYRVGLAILRGSSLQCLMLRMDWKAVLHVVEIIVLAGNKQLSVDVHKKVTGLFCIFWLMSDKAEKHLWVEEIMVEKHHCHCKYQKHPIYRDFSLWSSWTCIIHTLLRSYFQWWLWYGRIASDRIPQNTSLNNLQNPCVGDCYTVTFICFSQDLH